ncbi:FUSC family protein [Azorhizobium doebereinerae]|uniref:FUSC family protein n=1 Tax=Azorhizobium doebereinerae TaxID=281091 RepID=UPI0004097306|nr:FUSC family protein [Azorhizobium doebereinerae]
MPPALSALSFRHTAPLWRGAVWRGAARRAMAALQSVDPGLVRLLTACRALVALTVTGGVVLPALVLAGHPITAGAPALVFAMTLPVLVRQGAARDYARALAVVVGCALAAYGAGTLLAPLPAVVEAVFVLVLALGVLVHPLGPVATAAGMVSGVLYYVGLYLHPAAGDLAAALAAVPPALAIVVVACRVLMPLSAATVLRGAAAALACRGARALRAAAEGRPAGPALARLTDAALTIEDHLALTEAPEAGERGDAPDEGLAGAVLDFELAVGRLVVAAPPREAGRLLLACARRLEEGTPAAPCPGAAPAGPLRRAVREVDRAARRMLDLAGIERRPAPPRRAGPAAPAALAWQAAARVLVAGALALSAGLAISPERWFWAVFSVFLVLLGMRSRAEMIHRSAQRILGTVAGVVVGAGATYLLRGHPVLEVALMLACVFGWAFFILHAYARAIFFVTLLVGLVYGALGATMSELLEIRLAEVLAGCLIAMLCALAIFPVPTRPLLAGRVRAVLGGLADVVGLARARFAGPADLADPAQYPTADPAPDPTAAMRRVDRGFREAVAALVPLEAARRFVVGAQPDLLPRQLAACLHWTRQLARLSATVPAAAVPADLAGHLAAAEHHLRAAQAQDMVDEDGLAAGLAALEAALRLLPARPA